jgi:hypothetical protein
VRDLAASRAFRKRFAGLAEKRAEIAMPRILEREHVPEPPRQISEVSGLRMIWPSVSSRSSTGQRCAVRAVRVVALAEKTALVDIAGRGALGRD